MSYPSRSHERKPHWGKFLFSLQFKEMKGKAPADE
jgi:hypothetical protein